MKAFLFSFFTLCLGHSAQAHDHGGGHLVFANGTIHAHLSWVQGPTVKEPESILKIEWKNGLDHTPKAPPSPFRVTAFMPDHDHGTRVRVQRIDETTYLVNRIFFPMGGKWEIRLALVPEKGQEEMQALKFELPDGGHHGHSKH